MIAIPILLTLIVASLLMTDVSIKTEQTKSSIQEGKRIYTTTCMKCHNANPHKPGSIGPDLYSTPKEVFATKIVHGMYPEGYTPKRKTRVMPKFKNLEGKVDSIHEYVKSIAK